MLKIDEQQLNAILHSILNLIMIVKMIESDCLSQGQQEILHGVETRLSELRQQLLESLSDKK